MKIETGHLCIDVPDTFEDVTSYVFDARPDAPKEGGPPDRLSVAFEPMPAHISEGALIAQLRRTMERQAGPLASFEEGSATAGKLPLATLSITFAGSPGGMFFAAFRWPGDLAGRLQYESSREDAATVFNHIATSVRAIGVRAAPPPGLVRRRAGPLWICLPETLAPVSSYTFSTGGGRARLFLDEEGTPGEAPRFEAWVDHGPSDILEIEPLNEGAFAADRRPIEERAWRVDRLSAEGDPLGSTWFRVAWVSFEEGRAARVWMIERQTPRTGDACWDDIVAGIQLAPGAP